MKAGYSRALQRRIETPDRTARLYTSAAVTLHEDTRKTDADFAAASSSSNVQTGLPGGGLTLISVASTTNKVTHGADTANITDLDEAFPWDVVALEADSPAFDTYGLASCTFRLHKRPNGALPEFDGAFVVRAYWIQAQGGAGGFDQWVLLQNRDSVRVDARSLTTNSGDVTFTFPGAFPQNFPPTRLRGPGGDAAPMTDPLVGVTLLLRLMAVGGSNANYALRTDGAAATTINTPGVGTLRHRKITGNLPWPGPGEEPSTATIADTAVGMPRCTIAMVDFDLNGNVHFENAQQLDLGATPTGTVEFVVDADVPNGTALAASARVAHGDPWTPVKNRQTPADVGLAVSRTYEMKADLSTPAATVGAPRLYRLGIADKRRTDFTNCAEWVSDGQSVDPFTSAVTVEQAELKLRHLGERDYRSTVDRLLTGTDATEIEFETWYGADDLPLDQWLYGDLWRLDDLPAFEVDGVRLRVVSVLERAGGTFPLAAGQDQNGLIFKAAASDTPDGSGDVLVTRELSEGVETPGTYVATVPASATRRVAGLQTKNTTWGIGIMVVGAGWRISVSVAAHNTNIWMAVRAYVAHANGTVYEEWPATGFSDEQQLTVDGVYSFTIPGRGEDGGFVGDRIRLDIQLRNADGGAPHSVTLGTGTADTMIQSPNLPTAIKTPVRYVLQTPASVWQDWFANQVQLDPRYLGQGPVDGAAGPTWYISKNLLDAPGIREGERIASVLLGTNIASQGKIKFVPLHTPLGPIVLALPYAAHQCTVDLGLASRLPTVIVPYGYDGDGAKFAAESSISHTAALSAYGISRIENPDGRIEDDVAKWITSAAHAEWMAQALVNNLATGQPRIHSQPIFGHPQLEIGDPVAVQTDQLIFRNPTTDEAVIGLVWVLGVVAGHRGMWREELEIWPRSFAELYVAAGSIAQHVPFDGVLCTASVRQDPGQFANAKVTIRAFPPGAIIYWFYAADGVAAPETSPVSDLWTVYDSVVTVPRDQSSDMIFSCFAVVNGVRSPIFTARVPPDSTPTLLSLSLTQAGAPATAVVAAAGVDTDVREIAWYRADDATGALWPTIGGLVGGTPDPAKLTRRAPIDALGVGVYRDGTSALGGLTDDGTATRGGAAPTYALNRHVQVLAVPYDYNGNRGPVASATYQVAGAAGAQMTSVTITGAADHGLFCVNPRTYDFGWVPGAAVVDLTHRLDLYCAINGAEQLVHSEDHPVSVTTALAVPIQAWGHGGQPAQLAYFRYELRLIAGNVLLDGGPLVGSPDSFTGQQCDI